MHNADHRKITLRAINFMRNGTKDKFTHLLEQYGKQIAKKSFDEDVYWHNTHRIVDWHFYKTASAPYPAPLGRFRPFWGISLVYLGDSETTFTAKVDGVEQECGTGVFWLTQGDGHSPEYLPGFGRYGKWNTKFGLAKAKTDGSLDLSDSKTIYDYLLEKMVIDTIKTLLIIKRQITPHEGV